MTDTTTPADEREALRAFADEILSDWPEGFPDGFGIQDLAVKHGLLIGTERTTPCELAACNCAEYHGDGEQITCYRRSELLEARAASQPAHDLPLDLDHEPADLDEAKEMLRRAKALTFTSIDGLHRAMEYASQPAQEPVAWQWLDTAHFRKKIPAVSNVNEWRPLYAAPPADTARQPAQEALIARLQLQVKQADERGDEAMRRAHAAEKALEDSQLAQEPVWTQEQIDAIDANVERNMKKMRPSPMEELAQEPWSDEARSQERKAAWAKALEPRYTEPAQEPMKLPDTWTDGEKSCFRDGVKIGEFRASLADPARLIAFSDRIGAEYVAENDPNSQPAVRCPPADTARQDRIVDLLREARYYVQRQSDECVGACDEDSSKCCADTLRRIDTALEAEVRKP